MADLSGLLSEIVAKIRQAVDPDRVVVIPRGVDVSGLRAHYRPDDVWMNNWRLICQKRILST